MLNQCLATYRGHRFPKEIISHSVWLYFRFAVSFAMWKNYWPRVAFWSAMQRCEKFREAFAAGLTGAVALA
jgi:putative transposase